MPEPATPRHCPACLLANPLTADTCTRCGSSLAGALGSGSLIAGRYQFVRELGSGGMGVVFEVVDRTLDETVALKLLRSDLLGQAASRLRSEIKLARRVAHRNVCRIFEYGEDGPARFIVMELVDGETLRQRLRRGPLAPEDAVRLVAQAADGLAAIHEAGIVHRDVKTPNLMLAAGQVVKVMDFGIAKPMGVGEGVTQTGMLVGTPEYMSPEQAAGRPLDGRSDLYSLGIVLYELLASDVPFRGDTPVATLWKHLNEAPRFDTPAAQRIPMPVQPLLQSLLAKSVDERPASGEQVASALRAAADEIGSLRGAITARTAPPVTRTVDTSGARTADRRHTRALPLAVVAALAIVLAAYLVGRETRPRGAADPSPSPAALAPAAPTAMAEPPVTTGPTAPVTTAPPPTAPPRTQAALPATVIPGPPTTAPQPTPPPTTTPRSGIVEETPPDKDAMVRAMASLEQGQLEQARRQLDAILARKDALSLPVARAKRGGLDRWMLTVQPAKTVTKPGGGLRIYANHLSLADQRGQRAASAMMRNIRIEGRGKSHPRKGEADPSPGAYLRLTLGEDRHTLYFWPTVATCRQARSGESNQALLQCDARGLAQQEFVAAYVAETIGRLGRASAP